MFLAGRMSLAAVRKYSCAVSGHFSHLRESAIVAEEITYNRDPSGYLYV